MAMQTHHYTIYMYGGLIYWQVFTQPLSSVTIPELGIELNMFIPKGGGPVSTNKPRGLIILLQALCPNICQTQEVMTQQGWDPWLLPIWQAAIVIGLAIGHLIEIKLIAPLIM